MYLILFQRSSGGQKKYIRRPNASRHATCLSPPCKKPHAKFQTRDTFINETDIPQEYHRIETVSYVSY